MTFDNWSFWHSQFSESLLHRNKSLLHSLSFPRAFYWKHLLIKSMYLSSHVVIQWIKRKTILHTHVLTGFAPDLREDHLIIFGISSDFFKIDVRCGRSFKWIKMPNILLVRKLKLHSMIGSKWFVTIHIFKLLWKIILDFFLCSYIHQQRNV